MQFHALCCRKAGLWTNFPALTKTLRVVKLTAIILLVFCLQVSARVNSQTITFSGRNVSLENIFEVIKKQTGYVVFWDKETIKHSSPITIETVNASLETFLKLVFKDQPLLYNIQGKNISIRKKENLPSVSISSIDSSHVTGVILDEEGKPLSGVNITIRGTNSVVVTDVDGKFTIDAQPGTTLIISSVEFETQQFKITSKQKTFSIKLIKKISSLNEVVVNKGYYSEKERLSVGNVSHVNGEDIRKQPVTDPLQALEGRIPGLSISQTSGIPGSYSTIKLRGQNFFHNSSDYTTNDPLFLIDGVPFNSQTLTSPFSDQGILGGQTGPQNNRPGMSPFSLINPAEIESIDVLKDADATAIYGARGANGVILITTRKGKLGPMKVDINLSAGQSRVARKLDLLHTSDYLMMRREAFRNDGIGVYSEGDHDINGDWDTSRYTDWQKELVDRPAAFTNAQANVSGGNEYIQYTFGGAYSRQKTTFPGNFANTNTSFYLNLSTRTLNERLHMSISASYNNDNSNLPGSVDLNTALTLPPNAPALYDADGKLNWQLVRGSPSWDNPLAKTLIRSGAIAYNLNSNLFLSYNLIKGLDISTSLGYNKNEMNGQQTMPLTAQGPNNQNASYRNLTLTTGNNTVWIIEPKVAYHHEIAKGQIELLIGSTFQENTSSQFANKYSDFESDAFITNPGAANHSILYGYYVSQYKYNSLYGRVGYNWEEKYLFNFTTRRDGSSRFGPSKQFGNFGSAGLGWIFSKEKFIENEIQWLNFGKLRASYGSVGSDAINDYQFMRTYDFDPSSYQGTSTLTPSGHANPDFQWQSVKKLEFGMDLGFLNERLNITASYYSNRTSNQLVGYPLPSQTGFGSVIENLPALINNKGWEFTANTINIQRPRFRWTTAFNLTRPENKLVSFPGIANTSYFYYYSVGYSLDSRWLFHYLGVDPQTGTYTFASKNGTGQPGAGPYGTDMYWSKPITQQLYGGLLNSLTYKNFSINTLFQFVKQRSTYMPGISIPGDVSGNQPSIVLKRWMKINDQTNIQLFSHGANSNAVIGMNAFTQSDGAIVDGSFIRLKNVALSYSLPENWRVKAHLTGIRIHIEFQNLFVITKYPGWDPETGMGIPPYRTISGGIELNF